MIVLDTSFLVAFFNEEDSQHRNALEDMKKVESEVQLMSNYVALETATVLKNKKNLTSACEFLEIIKRKERLNNYTLTEMDFEGVYRVFKNQKNNLSFIDAAVVYLALETNSEAATYDKDILEELKRLRESTPYKK